MKSLIATATIATLIAGAAFAERPNSDVRTIGAQQTIQVPAGSVYSGKDLHQFGLKASDKLTVTDFPPSGLIDLVGHDN